MRPTFDERDDEILAARSKSIEANPINLGDFIRFADGTTRRVSHVWCVADDHDGPSHVQTSHSGSWYLGDGYLSFSGALYNSVRFESLVDTGDRHDGLVWFFHHNYAGADRGVECVAKFRVWACSEAAPRC